MKWRMTRRGFLIGLGATGGALVLGAKFGLPILHLKMAEMLDGGGQPSNVSTEPSLWFEITPDNRIRLHMPKSEMGQGIHTALAQIAAEELEVAWDQLEVIHASTARENDAGGTAGSTSVTTLFTPVRETAVALRQMLLLAAAQQLSQPLANLTATAGTVATKDNSQSLTYGQIVAAKSGAWEIPQELPALKPVSAFKVIGQPLHRVDLPAKIMGKAVYGYDARVEGMLYGAILRPPQLESKLTSVDVGTANEQPGVVKVLIEKDFAGVVAESRAAARGGVANLNTQWQAGYQWQQAEIESLITVGEGKGVTIQKEGRVPATAPDQIVAEYRTPMAAHAHLEPQAALADVQADKVTIWVSTQFPFTVRQGVAKALNVDESIVEVNVGYLGGGFGRKYGLDVAIEAARLSQAAGKPVHVGWDRTEEMRYGYRRPPTHHVLRGSLDSAGKISALEHHQASGRVAFGFLPSFLEPIMGADFGAWRGARIHYAIPNLRTVAWLNDLPMQTGWWRGLGLLANVFAIESFMDEMAFAAKTDPLEFRLRHLPEGALGERYKNVLNAVAEASGWGTAVLAGRGRGLALAIDVNTIVAQVVEVSEGNGRPQVHKVTCAIDPGLVINPNGVKAQTEGAIIMGLSSTLVEELTVKNGMIEAGNFDLYPLITMTDVPDINVVLVSSGDEPFGMGEPPIAPIAAATANATFALTGQRLRRLPLRLA